MNSKRSKQYIPYSQVSVCMLAHPLKICRIIMIQMKCSVINILK
jgi:hypothetical protein